MISAPDINLNPVKFDQNSVDSALMPSECIITLPGMYTANVSAASFFSIKNYTVDNPTTGRTENKKE